MPRLKQCPACEELVFEDSCTCPHCGHAKPCRSRSVGATAALLGLALVGCGDKDGNSNDSFAVQAEYGVAETGWVDNDGDGVTIREGDCDDSDASINPNAEETPGDGIDSNCNGDDDT